MRDFVMGIQVFPIYLALIVIMIILIEVASITQQKELVLIFVFAVLLFAWFFQFRTFFTKYQIFSDKIRIVQGWTFHFDIPFSNIENVKEATLKDLWGFQRSFVHSFLSGDDVVQIARKRGLKVNMIPGNRTLFLEHLNKALSDWRRQNPG